MPASDAHPAALPPAIGGYLELELRSGEEFHTNATRVQSGRAAFLCLLQSSKPRRVWMPRFICDSMLEPLKMTGTRFSFYDLTADFCVSPDLRLEEGDNLLYVNYFGLCGTHVKALKTRFPSSRLIVDNTQAFYDQAGECAAAIYSPRKFFGVPDGGYLVSALPFPDPLAGESSYLPHLDHLLKRLGNSPEAGYADFQAAEQALSMQPARAMSRLTRRLLASIDYAGARLRRCENFGRLHANLARLNAIRLPAPTGAETPMCYPFLAPNGNLRELLRRSRIYTPTYWTEVAGRSEPDSLERQWVDRLVPLPVDQRYTMVDMQRVVDAVMALAG